MPLITTSPLLFATSPHPLALHSRLYPPRSLYHYPTHKRKPSILRGIHILRVRLSPSQTWYARSFYRLPAALCLPTSHQELGNYTSRLILSFLRFLARWPGWYGIAVLPCFSASKKVPVTRCGLPLRGTYAAYCPQPPAPKGGLSREEETEHRRHGISLSMSPMLIYPLKMLPFFMQLLTKTLNVDVWCVLVFDRALL